MVLSELIYKLKCDVCGCVHYDNDWGFCEFLNADEAIENAQEQGWKVIDGKHVCPACQLKHYELDSDNYD